MSNTDRVSEMLQSAPALSRTELREKLARYTHLRDNPSPKTKNEMMKIRDLLIASNMRLVVKFVNRKWSKHALREELIQEGTFGLIQALDRFDSSKPFVFSTYAQWWIKHFTYSYMTDNGHSLRLPQNVRYTMYNISKARSRHRRLTNEEADVPTLLKLLSDKKDITELGIKRALAAPIAVSTENTVANLNRGDKEVTIGDMLLSTERSPEDAADLSEKLRLVERAFEKLTSREIYIIVRRFGLDERPEEQLAVIGEKLNLSRERVRQIENDVLARMARDAGVQNHKHFHRHWVK